MKAKYQHIDFFKNEKDFATIYYAGIGLSSSCIQELTGFTRNQISRRLKIAGIGLRSYRSGNTPVARFIIKTSRPVVEKYMMKQLS